MLIGAMLHNASHTDWSYKSSVRLSCHLYEGTQQGIRKPVPSEPGGPKIMPPGKFDFYSSEKSEPPKESEPSQANQATEVYVLGE
jgi:hypothetical protein